MQLYVFSGGLRPNAARRIVKQLMQLAWPDETWDLPVLQAVQGSPPVDEYWPGMQDAEEPKLTWVKKNIAKMNDVQILQQ